MIAIMSTPRGPPVHNVSSPGETPDKETDSEIFKALRKHVEYKQMDMGEMVRSQGLSSALAAMEEAEINPIVQHGEWCGLCIVGEFAYYSGHSAVTVVFVCRNRRVADMGRGMGSHTTVCCDRGSRSK